MIVSDNTIQAEGLGDFFKNLGKVSSEAAKRFARNALKNPSRFLISVLTLLQQRHVKIPKQHYQYYLK